MTHLNRHQPDRPRKIESVSLNYRTLPVIGDNFKVTNHFNIITSARLYRAVRRGDIPNFVGIQDLHDFCFPDKIYGLSKKTMGAVVIRTVRYNPRKLLGVSKTNDKPRVLYAFGHMKEFEYGLEWMICTWLRKFLNESRSLRGDRAVSGPDMVDAELTRMVECSDSTFNQEYEKLLWQFRMDEPDWRTIAANLEEPKWEFGTENVERRKLRSYR